MTQTTQARVTPRKAATKEVAPVQKTRRAVTRTVSSKGSPLQVAAGIAQKFYVFVAGARPTSGPRLHAHTNAVLIFLGLAEKNMAKKQAVLALIGERAFKYHSDNLHFETKKDMVKLTPAGYVFFKTRATDGKVRGELSEAFYNAITAGKLSVEAEIKATHIRAVSMAVR